METSSVKLEVAISAFTLVSYVLTTNRDDSG